MQPSLFEKNPMLNPLLSFDDLPLFDQICHEHVEPAIKQLLDIANAALETVTAPDFAADWNAISMVLDVATERLARAWGAVTHLKSVADHPELRQAFNAVLPSVTWFYTRLSSDERLYAKYKAIAPHTLTQEQTRSLSNALRNFVLGGAQLQGDDRTRCANIQDRQATASQKFSENALDATDSFAYYASSEELDGVPVDIVQTALSAAKAEGQEGYKLTLKMPCYLPVMQFSNNRALREKLYRAYVTRASDQADEGSRQFDNSALITELLALRLEEAKLLGYTNFAEVSLVPKMAESPQRVITFLRDLAARARPYAEKDVSELRAFALEQLGMDNPQPWDWPYLSEQLKQARYAFNEQEVKHYFTLPKVLEGLFQMVETLFDVKIRPDHAPVWHENVLFYRVERTATSGSDSQGSTLIGQFYLDTTARNGKRGGAWMDCVRDRWLRPDTQQVQTPVAQLVCNFASVVDGKPALLMHDDVITLFHEFGHGLQHMLTQVNERDVSGINGVEWDAVELPSQFMENFCWEWRVIEQMSAHVDTQKPLPRALFDKMLNAKNFQSGMQTLRQIEFSLFDMLLHERPALSTDIMPLLQQVRDEVAVLPAPNWARPAHTFSHIFSGGYAAGYYSYKWAEVLSSDAYAAFEETAGADGQPDINISRHYRQTILETGGSRPAMESFKEFRGREPTMDAMLRHQGMAS